MTEWRLLIIIIKLKKIISWAFISLIILVYIIKQSRVVYEYKQEPRNIQINETFLQERVVDYPYLKLRKELIPVCSCESNGKPNGIPTHYEQDGITVLRGKLNNDDIGMCQINLKWHKEVSIKMGLDLFKEEDNIIYANFLFDTRGFKDWGWSNHCHHGLDS